MKSYHPTPFLKLLCLIIFTILINYSCNKDNDLLEDAVLVPNPSLIDTENLRLENLSGEDYFSEENLPQMGFESRTAVFRPINPKLSENNDELNNNQEYSHIKFDLSKIDVIGGTIEAVNLGVNITGEGGSANISIFKESAADQVLGSETNENQQKKITFLGELNGEFKSNQKLAVNLENSELLPEVLTLMIPHNESSNLIFAANDVNKSEPLLYVTYFVRQIAKSLPEDERDTDSSSDNQSLNAVYATASTGNQAPDARPSATVISGEAPLKVQFGSSKSSDDKGIVSYQWYFMDGTTATGPSPSHTFTKPGIYKVILAVEDREGLRNARIIIITVNESINKMPDARPSASPISGDAPLKVQFGSSKSSDDKGIVSYQWYFMDGSTATGPSPVHTFMKPGVYNVILAVEDKEGLRNARIIIITVNGGTNNPPDARPSASPTSGAAPLKVQFGSDKSSDDKGIVSYSWDFKDGTKATGPSPSHTFTQPGTYNVVLTVTDKEGLRNARIIVINVQGTSSDSESNGGTGGSLPPSIAIPSNAVKASSFGYNSSDATNALKSAINSSHSTIIVDKQAGDWVVGPLHFNGINNKTIIFESGVVLRAKNTGYRSSDRLFQLINSSNVEIIGYGATLRMNRSYHTAEQNHVLSIISSSNITVKGLTTKDGGGDGIYISRYRDGEYCRNILIEDITSTNNRRQGMSVISVDGLVVRNSTFSNSNGHSPGAGVDFEVESIRDRLLNITMDNCVFRDNYGPGLLMALNKSSSSSMPLDITLRNSYFTNNSRSNPRAYPTEIELGMSTDYRDNPIKGTVTFDGLTVENSRFGAIYTKKTAEAYKVVVKNANFKNVSTGSKEAAIHIGVLSYANRATANMGGFTFENVSIDYDGIDPSLQLFGPGHNNWNLKDIHGQIKVRSPRGIQLSDNMNKLATTKSSSVTLKVIGY